jgi:hypothetical protein
LTFGTDTKEGLRSGGSTFDGAGSCTAYLSAPRECYAGGFTSSPLERAGALGWGVVASAIPLALFTNFVELF